MSLVKTSQQIGFEIEIPEYKLFRPDEIQSLKSVLAVSDDDNLMTMWKANNETRNQLYPKFEMDEGSFHTYLKLNKKIKLVEQEMLNRGYIDTLISSYTDEVRFLQHCVQMGPDLNYKLPNKMVSGYFNVGEIPATKDQMKILLEWRDGALTKERMFDLSKSHDYKKFLGFESGTQGGGVKIKLNDLAEKVVFLYEQITLD